MERDSDLIEATPDLDFDGYAMEQETPDIDFSNIDESETPDINFSENVLIDSIDKGHERFGADESDIDDMDEPDQYVEDETDDDAAIAADGSNESITNDKSESFPHFYWI